MYVIHFIWWMDSKDQGLPWADDCYLAGQEFPSTDLEVHHCLHKNLSMNPILNHFTSEIHSYYYPPIYIFIKNILWYFQINGLNTFMIFSHTHIFLDYLKTKPLTWEAFSSFVSAIGRDCWLYHGKHWSVLNPLLIHLYGAECQSGPSSNFLLVVNEAEWN
jgi:hypothetical protein